MTDRIDAALRSLRKEHAQVQRRAQELAQAITALEKLTGASPNGGTPRRRGRGSPIMDAAVRVLRSATEPMHIQQLMAEIKRTHADFATVPTDKIRATLVSGMLRRKDVFNNPKRGHYGLTEMEEDGK